MEFAARVVDIAEFRVRQQAARADGRWLGLGVSVFSERTGPGTPAFEARRMVINPGFERVELAMDPSGFLEARIGSSPHGQGLKTTLAQLIAEETGITPEKIRVVAGDTDRCPYGWGTFASRSLVIAGGACKLAAATLRDRLQAVAGQMLEAAGSDIEIGEGRAFVRGTDLGIELRQVARALPITRATVFRRSPKPGWRQWRPTTRTARSRTPATSRLSRSTSRRAKSRSSGSSSSRTPVV
jgi:carbon-monoxide dehydrogenase large subunit